MQTKQEYAYEAIKDHITSGELLPGQRIVVNRLAHEIGTSAIPIREALLRLEGEGLVTITPHVGAVVALITGQRIEMTLESLAVMEGYATRLAASQAAKTIPELEHHSNVMESAAEREDWELFSIENRRFHFAVYNVVDNSVLTKTIGDLWSQLDSYLSASAFYLMPDRARGSIDEHARIIEMLKDPSVNLNELEYLAREHKFNTAKRLRPIALVDETQRVRFPAEQDIDVTG